MVLCIRTKKDAILKGTYCSDDVCVCVGGGMTPIISLRGVSENFRRKLYNIEEFREVTKSMAQSPS